MIQFDAFPFREGFVAKLYNIRQRRMVVGNRQIGLDSAIDEPAPGKLVIRSM